jgi:biotin transporter BioY
VSADWYLILSILGPALGFLLVVAAIPFLIYSFCARNRPRAFTASKIAVVLSLVSVLASALLWLQLITGYYRYDNRVDYGDPDFIVWEVAAGLEAAAVLVSILSAARQRAHRNRGVA